MQVQQTTSACLWTPSLIRLESGTQGQQLCLCNRIWKPYSRNPCISTMFLVLCVLSQHVRWSWWSQLRKTSCPDSWIREYYGYLMGYLMSGHYGHYRSMYSCMCWQRSGVLPGSHANDKWCTILPCWGQLHWYALPPYDPLKELNCVVCTKWS
jgi:hypothetical protein